MVVLRPDPPVPGAMVGALPIGMISREPAARDLVSYRGAGAWVDVFDYAPAYQGGGTPPLQPSVVDELVENGVQTLFLQAARNDARSPDGLVDHELLAKFLIRAHRRDLRVVAWYLPTFSSVDVDFRNLELLAEFEVLGHRFDGVAVDIEYTEAVEDHDVRNERLVELSERLRRHAGDEVIGAIVLPPVQTEVVNKQLWPEFPWTDLADLYDVWLPMSYWTFRREASGYNDGYTYNEESVRRLRANLDDDDAPVHSIGGIGDQTTPDDLEAFVRSLVDTRSIGGSIYDWQTLSDESRDHLREQFTAGPAAELGTS